MLMRVSIGIHKEDINSTIDTYRLMSQRWFNHASATVFNSRTPRAQLTRCFLICMKEDSIEGIYDVFQECAVIRKSGRGIGVSIHNIRATGSYIRCTNGASGCIVPMLCGYSMILPFMLTKKGTRGKISFQDVFCYCEVFGV